MIIDTHAHIGTLPPFDMTIDQLLYSMDAYGIDFTILSNIEGAENDHQGNPVPPPFSKPQNQLLRETVEAVRPYSDRLGVMPWLRIQHELPDDEFVSLLKENRDIIYGFKLHPFHSLTAPDDERLEPVYRLAAEFDLPVVSHTGGCEQAMSPHLYNAAKRHPELKFVMVHMDLGTDNSVALDLLGKLPNLYGDTTWVPVSTTVEAIRRELERWCVVRTSWLYGREGRSFARTILGRSCQSDPLRVVNDQIGTPTFTEDLARLLVDMAEAEVAGTYHAVNEGGYISWYEFAREIVARSAGSASVIPVTTEEYGLALAQRPKNSRLDTASLDEAGIMRLPDWRSALARFLSENQNS